MDQIEEPQPRERDGIVQVIERAGDEAVVGILQVASCLSSLTA